MKLNRGLFVMSAFVLALGAQSVMAEETITEKAGAKGHDVKREVKKAGHRVEEGLCADGDVTCAGRKVKNRAVEAKDATVDGAKKLKNKVD